METGNGIANSNQKTQFSRQNQANRTRTIQKIPAFKMLAACHGIFLAVLSTFSFFFGGIAMIIIGIIENEGGAIVAGSAATCLIAPWSLFGFKKGNYVPGKSFFFARFRKETL
jgi:hypothetical protein